METKYIRFFKDKYFFLSNFYGCQIYYGHKIWPSSEHLYQALKTLDMDQREYIRTLKKSSEAKYAGKQVTLRDDWEEVRIPIMKECVTRKFKQNTILAKQLINTYPLYLLEGNYHHDNYWGNCLCKRCEPWVGSNNLGILLMDVRSELMNS